VTALAVTGGTGFVGSTLIAQALAAGHTVRALTRRPQAPRDNVVWIEGSLETPDGLARLAQGADAVIHIAGVINAPDRAGFAHGNIEGTQAMVAATRTAGVQRFVHVSSLAAREPELSIYGWSKAGAEAVVMDSGLEWSMVRPPAVFGPGDMEMLELFRLAKHRLALLPPGGRLSVIEVSDLGRLLLALAGGGAEGMILEPDDGGVIGRQQRSSGDERDGRQEEPRDQECTRRSRKRDEDRDGQRSERDRPLHERLVHAEDAAAHGVARNPLGHGLDADVHEL